jgi:H+/Cl- antiporter ClcA
VNAAPRRWPRPQRAARGETGTDAGITATYNLVTRAHDWLRGSGAGLVALGSTLGQWLRVPESRLRLLVACGAAGGISATFNAPIAGVFFALELILRDFEAESFGVVVLASVTASVIGRAAFGNHPFLALPGFHLSSPVEFAFYAALGVAGALAGVGFTRVLYGIEDLCDRAWHGPERLRPAAGGVLLGGLLLVLPQMYGVGYPVLQNGVAGRYAAWFLLVLLARVGFPVQRGAAARDHAFVKATNRRRLLLACRVV